MRKRAAVVGLAVLTFALGASASPQKDTLARFYELRERMLGERGTEADVDSLLALFTPDGTYEHPAFGVKLTKEGARAGLLAHLREGTNARYTVRSVRLGKDFAIAEVTLRYTVNGKAIERVGVGVFEFKDNKIGRVAEY